jgi:quercetin dioxygenase-like cupin family protein
MRYSYPHTIDNGHGESLTFLRFVADAQGGYLEVENKVQPGAGPPMHVHHLQDESLTIVKGKLAAQILGQQPTYHGPGETLTFRRGEVHRFWNAGDEVLVCTGTISPAHNIEYFLTEIFRSVRSSGSHKPSLMDGAYLLTKYKSEFDMAEIPAPVKKIIFPLAYYIGKMVGSHRRFSDAPAAIMSA